MLPPFVDAAWLAAHRSEVRLLDVRLYLDGRDPRAAYEAGHLPGAVFVDGHHALAAPADPALGRHPLPSPQDFAAAMGRVGVDGRATVVAYDDEGGVMAARLVWLLRVLGVPAALLDGGLRAWGGPVEHGPVDVVPVLFTARPWPSDRFASIEDAVDPGQIVLDARPAERYAGAADALDPRAGHIPGSISLPCRDNLDPSGRLVDEAALRARFAAAGVDPHRPVVSSCGSGVTACHTLLVLEHVGLPAGRLYPGSWSQYSRTDRPVATGSAP